MMESSSMYQTPPRKRAAGADHNILSSTTETLHSNITRSTSMTSLKSADTAATMNTPDMLKKAEEINLILLQPEVDLWRLRELALSEGGLVNDTLRKRAWPRLVGLDFNLEPMGPLRNDTRTNIAAASEQNQHAAAPPPPEQQPRFEIDTSGTDLKKKAEDIPPNSLIAESIDAQQIERDVARCTWHLLTGSQRSRRVQHQNKSRSKKVSTLLKKKQRRLANLINLTLVESYTSKHKTENEQQHQLRYYQGYHDVACIFMHALSGAAPSTATPAKMDNTEQQKNDFELPCKVLQQVSFSHLSDALQSNFLQLQTGIKLVLFPLLAKLDPMVHNHLLDADMEPFFCLSWIITWFSHDVRDTSLVKRLFDAFIVSHPLLPVYMAIAMMIHPYNRGIILETDCDFASLHQVLASLPRHSCSVGWKKRRRESESGFDDGGLEYISDHEDEGGDECGCQPQDLFMPPAPRQPGGNKSIMTASTTEMEYSTSNAGGSSSVQSMGNSAQSIGDDSFNSQWIAIDHNGDAKSPARRPRDLSKSSKNPVPFQVVLDKALHYMKRYPPSCLVDLAQKYYADDWGNQLAMLNLSASSTQESMNARIQQQIVLLQPCPSFSIVPFCASDWVVKQRLGIKTSSRKNRRRKNKQLAGNIPMKVLFASDGDDGEEATLTKASDMDPMEFVLLHSTNLAVIAAGYGPGIGPEIRAARRRRLRRRLVVGTVFVGFLAMGGHMYFHNDSQDGMFGANTTRKMLGGIDSYLVDNTVCDAPASLQRLSSVPSNAEADAMNKAANVILPRINVLQKELPSPSSPSRKADTAVKAQPRNTSRATPVVKETPRKLHDILSTHAQKGDILANKSSHPTSSVITEYRQRIVILSRIVKRVFTRVFVEFILQPIKFIWGALKKEARMYALYG